MTDELQKKIVWQNINSSKERGKILSGKIIAIENEKVNEDNITCAIVDFKGIKVLIPATEIASDFNNDKKLLRNMMGAEIKFIIVETDKTSAKAVGSRIKAMERLREINIKKVEIGDKIYAKVVGVWRKFIRIECVGIDFIMKAENLQYGYIEDLSKMYKVNEQIKVVIKEISEDPFKNIRKDFTEKGEYLGEVTGYTDDGIFVNIAQGIDTICILPTWLNRPPFPGEKVIVKIYKLIPEKRKVYSSLVKIIGNDASE